MFLSHFNFFISIIVVFLFIIRRKHHTLTESLFVLFSVLFSISSLLWLTVNYYNFPISWLIDIYGIICENILLTIPVLALYHIDKKNKAKFKIILLLIISSVFLYFIHWLISYQELLIFYPNNLNITYNIIFQILLDILLCVTFFYFIFIKKKNAEFELFDGSFKKYFMYSFGLYYLQDIFVLLLLYLTVNNVIIPDTLFNLTTFINTFIVIHLVLLAIYTNWLKEYNYLRLTLKKSGSIIESNNDLYIPIEELREIKPLNWNEIKLKFEKTHPLLINKLEQNTTLSKTEKLYAFLDNFNFNNKDLSDILFVSIRTVETNFYRMRRKIKEE